MHTPIKLYPHQEQGVKYLQENRNAALYWEMRLGKTKTVIRALQNIPGRKLIICPKSVIPVWVDELEMEGMRSHLWFSSEFLKRIPHHWFTALPDWCVINYEAATRLNEEWQKRFQHIIVDESVNVKNPQAKLTKFIIKNFNGNINRKILLSGNPAPNTPLEYFSQMQFLHGGEWLGCKNWWQFRRRYFVPDYMGWQWWCRASSKEKIKQQLMKDAFILSRKDVGVENKKVYAQRFVEMPSKLKKEYNRMERDFISTLPDGTELEVDHVLTQLTFLQEMASGFLKNQEFANFKVKELVNLLQGELKGEQVLIWCRFRQEIEAIHSVFARNTELQWEGVIHGDVPLEERQKLQNAFKKGICRILILQIATSRYGLNLSSADTAIYFSNSLSPDDREQSEARIQLNEKKQSLLYIDLVCKDSIDVDILKALKRKQKQSKFFRSVLEETKKRYV